MSDTETTETITTEDTGAEEVYRLPDDDDLDAAIAEAEAEENAETEANASQASNTEDGDDPDPAAADAADTADADDAEGDAETGKAPMIPKGRFDEVRTEAEKAKAEAAYWKGVADARVASTQTQQTQEQGPTKEEQIDAQYAEFDKIDEAYQSGDITASQKARQEDAVRERIAELKAPPKAEPKQQAPTTPAVQGDAYVAEKTEQLMEAHPYVGMVNQRQLNFLEQEARADLAAQGKPFNPNSGASVIALRTRIAELSDTYGPSMTGKTLEGTAGTPATTSSAPAGAEAKAIAQARAKKMEAAEGHPPDISQVGTTAPGKGALTAEDVANMSEEEFDALPEATLNKVLAG